MAKAKVYTRTGDKGQTSLIGGKRVSKASARLEAYGTMDELSSYLGLLQTYTDDDSIKLFLENIQRTLFQVCASLATAEKEGEAPRPLAAELVTEMEAEIDRMEGELPPLRSFILTGGCRAAALAQVCRTICRRGERRIISLQEEEMVDSVLLSYVNRLSDYLFVLGRKLNFLAQVPEKLL